MPSADANRETARRTLWQRRVRDPLVHQLTQGITPEKLALTVAVGSALALFPVLGTTTLLCFIAGLALRLNQPIIQLLNQALWPVHVPVIYGCLRLGARIFGVSPMSFGLAHAHDLLWSHPALFFEEFGLSLAHAIVAWAIIAPAYIVAVYYLSLPIMRAVDRVKHRTSAVAAPIAPGDHPVP
ncbi:DUF2062 domain-containing protein [Opitutus terrae]|uniref:DUF2062 domain-containing protein n=1 Tax=Opitutus terrae TaxID=107709 RepID=UPI0013051CA7|nr:DUF2062 domain-containing protein [Opitutus terrae]